MSHGIIHANGMSIERFLKRKVTLARMIKQKLYTSQNDLSML